MPYDRPLDPTLAAMRQSGMPGRLKMVAQLAENEIIRGMSVTFLSRMVLLISVVLYETEANSSGLKGMFVSFIASFVSPSSFSVSCPLLLLKV